MENKPQSDLGQSRPAVRRPARVPARFPAEGGAPVATAPRPEPTEPGAMPAVPRPVPPKPAPIPAAPAKPEPAPTAPAKTRPEAAPAKAEKAKRTKNARRRSTKRTAGQIVWLVVRRILVVILTLVLLLVVGVFALCYTVATGPSPTIRNWLVLTAMQTSAAKWVPGLFMSDEEVAQIVADSHVVRQEEINMDEFAPPAKVDEKGEPVDEWAAAIDGMLYETISGPTFKGYVLLVKDPSRVYVATSSSFKGGEPGIQIFPCADRDGAIAGINGGEFWDDGGGGTGGQPLGLTYSRGKMVYQDWSTRTFIGIDKNDRLVVAESMTRARADELGIRDAVSFQNGNTLITNEDNKVTLHYNDDNTGKAQRTAIGQRADGTMILIVTDGRTAASLGATHNDIIDVMVSYGAVTAGMLDGGSSTMMYYRDWYTKYNVDVSTLDPNQRKGMVNKFKAFTPPRTIPTYFMVMPEEVGE